MRVLFTAQVGEGHWRPLAPFAQALAAAGHEVAFASTPFACQIIARHGFRCFPMGDDEWWQRPSQSPPAEPEQADAVAVNYFVPLAEHRLSELLTVARDWHPDLIVREQTEFAGCLVAEAFGLPHATVQISAFRGAALDQVVAAPLNRLRADLGLPPDPALAMLYRYLLLLPFPPRYQEPAIPLPPTAHFVRHVTFDLDHPGETLPGWIARLPPRPTIYATLGTAYNRTPGVFPQSSPASATSQSTSSPRSITIRTPPTSGTSPRTSISRATCRKACSCSTATSSLPTVGPAPCGPRWAPGCHGHPANRRRPAGQRPPLRRSRRGARCRPRPAYARGHPRGGPRRSQYPDYRQCAEQLRDEMQALPGPGYVTALLGRLAMERRPLVEG